jgi:dUTP pyrophosphatase
MIKVEIQKLHPDVELPSYAKEGDAGMDIRAYIKNNGEVDLQGRPPYMLLPPNGKVIIPTGIKVAIPVGYEIQVRPRSGMAIKKGLTVLNTPGTIDAGYRGEIGVILYNTNDYTEKIEHGERIAQIVLNKVPTIEWEVVEELSETERGSGGFGSTGTD